ncbi:unnamed protein product, partial [Heterosigma akashiwo]
SAPGPRPSGGWTAPSGTSRPAACPSPSCAASCAPPTRSTRVIAAGQISSME